MNPKQLSLKDLPITPVDPHSPLPLYYQIENDLRALLQAGHLNAGDLLPPELELARAYGVGRHTIRTALARLASENLILRRAGHGTVIETPSDRRQFYLDRSFTRQMQEMGLQPRSVVLEKAEGVLQTDAPRALQAYVGQPFLALTRLRFGNDEPIGLQYATIITARCPRLGAFDFGDLSLYAVLAQHFQLAISQITHTVLALGASAEQAAWLAVPEGQPLLGVKTNAYLDDGSLIEHTLSYYRADKYEYTTTHTYLG
jgi:GntR family transcriptional regulator